MQSFLPTVGRKRVLVVTCADGPEGFAIASAILRQGGLFLRAGVANTSSANSRALEQLGADLCLYDSLAWHRQLEPLFRGADAAFILAPLDAQREVVGTLLIEAAAAADVPLAMLLSVIGADAETAPESFRAYARLEKRIFEAARGRAAPIVLRTLFYQQNLLCWARDMRRTRKLRLPLYGCLPLLHQA